jgi:hypothetical protein
MIKAVGELWMRRMWDDREFVSMLLSITQCAANRGIPCRMCL